MSTRGCFCCPNICLNMKSSKQEGESLNTQISLKHSCWLKVKVKALEKSRATSKSVLCAYLHAVQYVVRFSSGSWEPSNWSRTRRRCRHFCFFPTSDFLTKAEAKRNVKFQVVRFSSPVTSFTALQKFRKLPSITDACPRLQQLWFPVSFSSSPTGFHSSSISHCWLGLSSLSGMITTWSLS